MFKRTAQDVLLQLAGPRVRGRLTRRWMACVITTSAGEFDLEDAEIVSVSREPGEIRIELRLASVRAVQQEPPHTDTATLRAIGVKSDVARYYVGTNVTAPHPDPSFPLNWVELASLSSGVLNLQGMLQGRPWFEWEVVAQEFVMQPHAAAAI